MSFFPQLSNEVLFIAYAFTYSRAFSVPRCSAVLAADTFPRAALITIYEFLAGRRYRERARADLGSLAIIIFTVARALA